MLPLVRFRAKYRQIAGLWALFAVGLACCAAPTAGADDEAAAVRWGDYFGFGPLEIFKLEFRSHSMIAADFNSDGRNDLAVVDNSHSRIDLLLQREKPP